jgi:hypothetical protein
MDLASVIDIPEAKLFGNAFVFDLSVKFEYGLTRQNMSPNEIWQTTYTIYVSGV